VIDGRGRPVRDALVEIWQCNSFGRYHDGRDDSRAPRDPYFQGYGRFVTETEGRYRFRTIRPVAYPGRTPHIHVKVSSREYGVLTSQIFIDGEAGNERDGVLRSLKTEEERKRVTMTLTSGAADSTAKWVGEFEIVVGIGQ
jgi:protocatechuate 3,4-dioxygenase beta subunit